jgi:hypothetical protein
LGGTLNCAATASERKRDDLCVLIHYGQEIDEESNLEKNRGHRISMQRHAHGPDGK